MASQGVVILFARTPRYGRGKRRLAREIGDLAAWRFYRRALARTVRVVARQEGWRVMAALDPPGDIRCPGPPFAHGPAARWPRRAQRGPDLGRRMVAALNALPPGPVVLIGADIQGVTPAILRRALRACRSADLVFGPADDGGFWLIGRRRLLSLRLLDGVAWSRETTLAAAIAAAPPAWRIRLVDRLADVDVAADLQESP